MLSDICKTCRRTFGQKAWASKEAILERDPEYPNYCTQGCSEITRKYLDGHRKSNFDRVMRYLDSGEVKTTLIGRSFDLSQEQSKEAFADFISNFMVQVETLELK